MGRLPWLLHRLRAAAASVERLAGSSRSSGVHRSSAHFLSMRCSAELPHAGPSCSSSSSTACPGTCTNSAGTRRFAAQHCFHRADRWLWQVAAFSRAFSNAALRLATGSMAPQTPRLCASQHQLFPTLTHDAFEH